MIENTHPKIKWTVMINLGELPPFLFLHSLVIRWRPSVEMRTALKNQLSRAAAISTAFSSFNLSGDRSILFSRFVSSFLSFVGSCSPFFAGSLGTLALIFAFIICLFVCLMNWLDRICFNCDYHLFFSISLAFVVGILCLLWFSLVSLLDFCGWEWFYMMFTSFSYGMQYGGSEPLAEKVEAVATPR